MKKCEGNIFSLLVLCRTNLWIACGLHGIWNFILYGIMGLTLSGNDATTKGLLKFEANILNGGVYGLEEAESNRRFSVW